VHLGCTCRAGGAGGCRGYGSRSRARRRPFERRPELICAQWVPSGVHRVYHVPTAVPRQGRRPERRQEEASHGGGLDPASLQRGSRRMGPRESRWFEQGSHGGGVTTTRSVVPRGAPCGDDIAGAKGAHSHRRAPVDTIGIAHHTRAG